VNKYIDVAKAYVQAVEAARAAKKAGFRLTSKHTDRIRLCYDGLETEILRGFDFAGPNKTLFLSDLLKDQERYKRFIHLKSEAIDAACEEMGVTLPASAKILS
jgi:hypothetical protein